MEQLHTGGKYMSARRTGTMQEASASPLPPSYRPLEHKKPIYVMGVNAVHASSLNTQPEVVNTGEYTNSLSSVQQDTAVDRQQFEQPHQRQPLNDANWMNLQLQGKCDT